MKVVNEKFQVQSRGLNPTFHDVTKQVKEIVAKSGVKNGNCVVYSQHTTCSVMMQECSHDKTYFGLEYLQQDLCNIMEKLIPTCRAQGQYMHPGKEHIEFAMGLVPRRANGQASIRMPICGRYFSDARKQYSLLTENSNWETSVTFTLSTGTR